MFTLQELEEAVDSLNATVGTMDEGHGKGIGPFLLLAGIASLQHEFEPYQECLSMPFPSG